MTMHSALHPKDDIDWVCMSRKEAGSQAVRTALIEQYEASKNS